MATPSLDTTTRAQTEFDADLKQLELIQRIIHSDVEAKTLHGWHMDRRIRGSKLEMLKLGLEHRGVDVGRRGVR